MNPCHLNNLLHFSQENGVLIASVVHPDELIVPQL